MDRPVYGVIFVRVVDYELYNGYPPINTTLVFKLLFLIY